MSKFDLKQQFELMDAEQRFSADAMPIPVKTGVVFAIFFLGFLTVVSYGEAPLAMTLVLGGITILIAFLLVYELLLFKKHVHFFGDNVDEVCRTWRWSKFQSKSCWKHRSAHPNRKCEIIVTLGGTNVFPVTVFEPGLSPYWKINFHRSESTVFVNWFGSKNSFPFPASRFGELLDFLMSNESLQVTGSPLVQYLQQSSILREVSGGRKELLDSIEAAIVMINSSSRLKQTKEARAVLNGLRSRLSVLRDSAKIAQTDIMFFAELNSVISKVECDEVPLREAEVAAKEVVAK